MNIQPFSPGATVTLAATAASGSTNIAAQPQVIRIYNLGPNKVFVRWGVGAQTAVVTDMPIGVGSYDTFSKGYADTFAAICAAAETAALYITTGEGQ